MAARTNHPSRLAPLAPQDDGRMCGCLCHAARRFALEPRVDALDHLGVVVAETVLGDVAEMRRQHEIVELAERMIDWQRLNREHLSPAPRNLLLNQRVQYHAFVDD